MKKKIYAGILGAMLALPTGAMAAGSVVDDLYWGVLLTAMRYAPDDLDHTYKPIGGTVKLGLELSERFAVEGRVGVTGSDDKTFDTIVGPIETEVQVDYYASAFGRLNVTTGRAKLYALLGVTHGKATGKVMATDFDIGISDDESVTDLSYGVGLDLYGTDHLAITVEYLRLIDKSDYYIDAANLGFTYSF